MLPKTCFLRGNSYLGGCFSPANPAHGVKHSKPVPLSSPCRTAAVLLLLLLPAEHRRAMLALTPFFSSMGGHRSQPAFSMLLSFGVGAAAP